MNLTKSEDLVMSEVGNEQLAELTELAVDTLPAYVEETPLNTFTQQQSDGSYRTVFVKDETRQPGRSFKDRGAAFAVGRYAALGAEAVLTASAGNHGMGMARAARHYGLSATVVVPESTEQVKKEAIAGLGAELVEVAGDFSETEEVALLLAEARKAQFVHPFADPYVAAGQGSIAVELLKQLPSATRVYVPVGGGGLLAGVGSVLKNRNPSVLVMSSQVDTANTFSRSVLTERLVKPGWVDARFGGLAVRQLDPRTFELGRRVTDRCVEVSPDMVFKAVYDYRQATGVLLEPAGAVGLAACFAEASMCATDEVLVTMLTGANASPEVGAYVEELGRESGWE